MRLRLLILLALLVLPSSAAAQGSADRSREAWERHSGRPAPSQNGRPADVTPRRYRAYRLDRPALARVLAAAPRERTPAAARPLVVSLPHPAGGFERFTLQRTQIMEPGLADRHPEIATYAGAGVDDPGASLRLSLTSLGLHASVRSARGDWYVDPHYRGSQSLYVTYRGEDLDDPHGSFVEGEPLAGDATGGIAAPRFDGPAVSLRQYRLAFLTDHTYAAYHGAANVTSAKVALINRVNQLYEDDHSIRLVLVAGNDRLNFNTAAAMTGAGGACGDSACFTSAQAASCTGGTLLRNHTVIGQVIGASNYDVGHIGMGNSGGGLARLGVVGRELKGAGCTGVTQPTGDLFAVDYVAHEIGHQFGGEHTFNGLDGSCRGNITASSVEPGSGSSVMAYAGICGTDDLQENSDPYFSQRSIQEIGAYASSDVGPQIEYQTVHLSGFDSNSDSFRLTFQGEETVTIARNGYSASSIRNALEALPSIPAGSIAVYDFDGADGTPSDAGFLVGFAGSLAGTDVSMLSLTSPSGVTGSVSETDQGGVARNGGSTITPTTNRAPVVTAPASYTIPTRTPFALTATADDADGDALVYSWEQNDTGAGKALLSNTKSSGPLFRLFHTAAVFNALQYAPPGQNAAGTSPTRVFPDMAQIVAGNTNAATGACPANNVACFSEFLPTSSYSGAMHFRVTVRDRNALAGGVAHADTTVNVATAAGPFRVGPTPTSATVGEPLALTWQVAGTNAGAVNTPDVRISLSTDGGATYPVELAASTPNDGEHTVTVPDATTSTARVRIEGLGNAFFDISDSAMAIVPGSIAATNDLDGAEVQYSDAAAGGVTATDTDGDASDLTAQATGLPSGPALTVASTSAGERRWELTGAVADVPGTYPVTVAVDDGPGGGPPAETAFTLTVRAEDATAAYTGPADVTGVQGAATSPVTLSAAVTPSADGTPGDLEHATVTFRRNGAELCAATPDAAGDASCTAALPLGTHAIAIDVGGRYEGSGAGTVTVTAPVFSATSDADPAGEPVQYSDPVGVTVSASDEDGPGGALTAQATGLPAGLALAPGEPSAEAVRPGTRTWTLDGTVDDAPGEYPVTVTVTDGDGHQTATEFTITAAAEDAVPSFTGESTHATAPGAGDAEVPLAVSVAEVPDGTPGDLALATVAFTESGTALCAVLPVADGGASCTATLGTGTHAVKAVLGGRYRGESEQSIVVEGTPPAPAPPAPAPPAAAAPTPTPTVSPPAVRPPAAGPRVDLTRVRRRARVRRNRVRIVLGCTGAAGTCKGRLKLTARVKRRRTVKIAARRFSIAAGTTRRLTVKLNRRGRRALRKRLRARLVVVAAGERERRRITLRR